MSGGSITELRRRNRDVVLRAIASGESVSRSQISRDTGLTGAAISRITRELIDAGLVKEGESIETKGQVGRRNICLELEDNGAFVVAVALTANVKSVSISDSRGQIVCQRSLENIPLENPNAVISAMTSMAREQIDESGIGKRRIVGCGISVAGIPDPETGNLIESEPLGWGALPLGPTFERALGMPVRVERRPVALLTAEMWRGAARGLNNIVLINNGLWLGGCVVSDGHVLTGPSNAVGQISHLTSGSDQTPCSCGGRGCLDVTASGISIVKKLSALTVSGSTDDGDLGARLRSLARYEKEDLPEVDEAFRQAGRQMGYAVDHLSVILGPELVLLAGETSRHPVFLEGVYETLRHLRPNCEEWPVKVSQITTDQSAVWLGLDAFVYTHTLDIEKLIAA